jgi:hypothetical protein
VKHANGLAVIPQMIYMSKAEVDMLGKVHDMQGTCEARTLRGAATKWRRTLHRFDEYVPVLT